MPGETTDNGDSPAIVTTKGSDIESSDILPTSTPTSNSVSGGSNSTLTCTASAVNAIGVGIKIPTNVDTNRSFTFTAPGTSIVVEFMLDSAVALGARLDNTGSTVASEAIDVTPQPELTFPSATVPTINTSTGAAAMNMVKNGDFEAGTVVPWTPAGEYSLVEGHKSVYGLFLRTLPPTLYTSSIFQTIETIPVTWRVIQVLILREAHYWGK
ncbi:hypothetical protein E4U58_003527 [Claviceps cyperi]|nr:hypothetical protein E4U58_003527 [Claviceps cyperi]